MDSVLVRFAVARRPCLEEYPGPAYIPCLRKSPVASAGIIGEVRRLEESDE